VSELKRCGDCAHGEAHGFSKVAEEHGWPVTVYFWCPVKKHHNVCREACDSYEFGETRRIYDDADW